MSRNFRLIFVALMCVIMVSVMAFTGTSLNYGYKEGFALVYFKTWLFMLPIAYITALVAVPISDKLTKMILRVKEDDPEKEKA